MVEDQTNNFRYEVKFQLSVQKLHNIYNWLVSSNYGFCKVFPDRKVNNLYYDNYLLTSYDANVAGISQRTKFRLRWYGEFDEVNNPVLEAKLKNNSLGCKKFYKLNGVYSPLEVSTLNFLNNKVKGDFKDFIFKLPNPTLFNKYIRQYYANLSGIRITIDTDVFYSNVNNILWSKCNSGYAILEVKYNQDVLSVARSIIETLNLTIEKNSKFVNGVEKIYGSSFAP